MNEPTNGHLTLAGVRRMFRLVGEIRELGADPNQWRPYMVKRLAKLMNAEIVVSSEIHFRAIGKTGIYRVHDIGWGCDNEGQTWQINTQREETPEAYWLSVLNKTPEKSATPTSSAPTSSASSAAASTASEPVASPGASKEPEPPDSLVAVKPQRSVYGGTTFVLSQYPLPHLGAVDQLGLHRAGGAKPFTHEEHRLIRLFHVELGRLWKKDAIKRAQDPSSDLPPRLAQTLAELQAGASEKQVSLKLGISRHTVHNYVKALHRRLGVSSRGELLAKARPAAGDFTPKLSVPRP